MKVERIAYVCGVFPKVSETFVANEMAELLRRGVQLRILSLRPPTEELRHRVVGEAGLDRMTYYDRGSFLAELDGFRPQFLHAHFATYATAAAREIARERGLPYTFTAHRYDIFEKAPKDFGERAREAAALITVSDANVEFIHRQFGVPREKMVLIPCGVDTGFFAPGDGRLDPPHVVCVARLDPVKNHAVLLEACARLRRQEVSFRCVLLGDGKVGDEVLAFRNGLGLQEVVDMPGAADQDTVRGWLRRAAISALSSDSEGMPVSLMESAACGLPVVATAVGGVPDLVGDGETGYVVPPRDPDAFADALERLLRDAALRARLGEAARARALTRFSLVHQVDQMLQIWERVLERRFP
ncbi:MAG TPA: glycosyltransferase [Burkholderiales bacterium]